MNTDTKAHSHHPGEHHHSASSSANKSGSGHHHYSAAKSAIKTCIVINALFLAAEAVIGMRYDSLSLIADAGYNLGDLLVLTMAIYSMKLRFLPSYDKHADSYRKYSVLSLIVNVAVLLVSVGVITCLAVHRLHNGWDHNPPGSVMAVTAGVGILVNGITTWILYKNQARSSGVRNAYLNMAADTFVSVVVVIAGLVLMASPSGTKADSIAALIACVVIVVFTVKLLYGYIKKGFRMVPGHIDLSKVVEALNANSHVMSCRHVNVFANHADEVEVTAHLSLDNMEETNYVRHEIKEKLRKMGVRIVTLSFKEHRHGD